MRINKVLITNDDGYDSIGIQLLSKILKQFANKVYVVAPKNNMSGSSRSITLKKEIKFEKKSTKSWIIEGTPTDCIIFALNHVFKRDKPDYIFSGINSGTNIGDEISYSGTIGAAFEGALRGIPSLALSQKITNTDNNFITSKINLPNILPQVLKAQWNIYRLLLHSIVHSCVRTINEKVSYFSLCCHINLHPRCGIGRK